MRKYVLKGDTAVLANEKAMLTGTSSALTSGRKVFTFDETRACWDNVY